MTATAKNCVAGGWFALFVVIWLVKTWHWPFLGDGALIRYVVVQMGHHFAPYRQIYDINMPGAYLLDWLTLRFLGAGYVPHRIYDCLLLGGITAAMVYIAGRRNRIWGFCGGCLFALFHARDGFEELGQRDLALAALLLISVSIVISIRRSGGFKYMGLFGLTVGFACTIKPVAIFFLLVAIPVMHDTRGEGQKILRWMIFGLCVPFLLMLGFVEYHGAFHAFLKTFLVAIPFHARLGAQPVGVLVRRLFSTSLVVWTTAVLLGWALARSNKFEDKVAGFAVAAGLLCYLVQMRGYNYHRYPFAAAIIAAMILLLARMYESAGWSRVCAVGLLLYCALLCPLFTQTALSRPRVAPQGLAQLEADLKQLPGDAAVQCIDSISGCIDTLVHLDRTQATGEMYDEFLFQQDMPPLLMQRRDVFLADLEKNPPSVLVVTAEQFPQGPGGYQKLSRWPAFNEWLLRCYNVTDDRFFPGTQRYKEVAYRLYERSQENCEK